MTPLITEDPYTVAEMNKAEAREEMEGGWVYRIFSPVENAIIDAAASGKLFEEYQE